MGGRHNLSGSFRRERSGIGTDCVFTARVNQENLTRHGERFRKALEAGVNIALVAYGQHHGSAWVGLETPGLDSRGDAIKESGTHNLKLVQPPLAVVEVRSPLKWLLMSRFATKARRRTAELGWPV